MNRRLTPEEEEALEQQQGGEPDGDEEPDPTEEGEDPEDEDEEAPYSPPVRKAAGTVAMTDEDAIKAMIRDAVTAAVGPIMGTMKRIEKGAIGSTRATADLVARIDGLEKALRGGELLKAVEPVEPIAPAAPSAEPNDLTQKAAGDAVPGSIPDPHRSPDDDPAASLVRRGRELMKAVDDFAREHRRTPSAASVLVSQASRGKFHQDTLAVVEKQLDELRKSVE